MTGGTVPPVRSDNGWRTQSILLLAGGQSNMRGQRAHVPINRLPADLETGRYLGRTKAGSQLLDDQRGIDLGFAPSICTARFGLVDAVALALSA